MTLHYEELCNLNYLKKISCFLWL